MNKTLFILLISVLMMNACNQKEKVDLIVHNAVVYTVNDNFDISQAFAIIDGKIKAVGSDSLILNNYESDIIVDADRKPVYPGFIDAHCHFYGYAMDQIKSADLTGTLSFEEVITRVQRHIEEFPSEWIEGRGWDQNDWNLKEFPTKELLDIAFPDKPVFLTRIDGHAAIVNSEALKRAGITAQTKIYGGEIQLEEGEPTGLLIDNALEIIAKIIPAPTVSMQRRALQEAEKNCFSVGLTSVQDAGLGKDTIDLIDKMQQEGSLNMRIYAMVNPTESGINSYLKKGVYSTGYLTVRSVKLYADGALGSRGAKMLEPYSDHPENTGLFMFQPEYYQKICELALENGFQVNTHAIGDAGNRFVLELYSKFLKGKNDLRWRIEHAQVVHPEDFKLFGELSVIPSVQPTHATSDMYWAEDRIGSDRLKGAYAYKKLLNQNGWIPLGTDFPVESINPLNTFYAAVARMDLNGKPESGFQIENALTREEALRGMTIWAAKSAFEENIKGSIEVGKFADFVILDKDIMSVKLDSVPFIQVLSTWSGGHKIYDSR
jgi:predicted amidohydrolase YtcJ